MVDLSTAMSVSHYHFGYLGTWVPRVPRALKEFALIAPTVQLLSPFAADFTLCEASLVEAIGAKAQASLTTNFANHRASKTKRKRPMGTQGRPSTCPCFFPLNHSPGTRFEGMIEIIQKIRHLFQAEKSLFGGRHAQQDYDLWCLEKHPQKNRLKTLTPDSTRYT